MLMDQKKFNIVKISILPKAMHILNAMSIKITRILFMQTNNLRITTGEIQL
jgi:hypothetical protein